MKRIIAILFFCFSLPAFAASAPEQLIRETSDRLLSELSANIDNYRSDPQGIYQLVDEVVLPHFDFRAMTNLALGKHRKKVSAEQKPIIVNEFRALLVRTYGSALLEYTDQKLNFLPMEGDEAAGKVTVRTEMEQAGGEPIPINYRLRRKGDEWKVYDISVDDVSLVTNYRSSFARAIKKNGVEGLIETLKARNESE